MIAKMRSSPHITIIILAIDPKGAPILSFPRPPPAPPSPHIMAPPETTVTTRRGPKTGTLWTIASTPPFSILGGNESKSRGGDDAVVSYRSPTTSLRGLFVTTDEPVCSLHILVATESNGGGFCGGTGHHPDDGLPRTTSSSSVPRPIRTRGC